MAGPSSSYFQDMSEFLQSIVDNLKVTQVKCLTLCLRHVPSSTEYYLKSAGVDIQPLFESLANSAVTEFWLETVDLRGNMQEFCKILVKSRIEILYLHNFWWGLDVDDILSLAAILKDTRMTELVIPNNPSRGVVSRLTNDQVNTFLAHLTQSHLRSLSIPYEIFPIRKMYRFFRCLQYSQITSLNLSRAFPRDRNSPRKSANIFRTFTSNLKHTALTNLNLESNKLDDSSAKALGRVLGNSKLERLNLSHNLLRDSGVDFLCVGLIHSKVTHLNLEDNGIHGNNALGESIKFTKIINLDLSKNIMNNGRIFSKLLRDSAVSVLNLDHCFHLNSTAPLPIPELGFSELTCLNLRDSDLSSEQIVALAGVLSQSNITHISLTGVSISEKCFVVLGDCLGRSVLKYVRLSCNGPSKDIIRGIISFIDRTRTSTVVSLHLRLNQLALDVIAPSLAGTKFLELDISANVIKTDIVRFAEQLKFTAITSLCLWACRINDEGAVTLANCLEESRVVLLDLSGNSVGNLGAKALAAALNKTKLRYLSLNGNSIEDDGLLSLAECAKNSCVTRFELSNNPGQRDLLVLRTTMENRTKVERFADLLKRTAFFTGDSHVFEFDRDFDGVNVDCFVEDLLEVYKTVSEKPYIVRVIEQDKCIFDLNKQNCCDLVASRASVRLYNEIKIWADYSEEMYKKIVEHPSPVQVTVGQSSAAFFERQALWLVLDHFPAKFASFVGAKMEGDLDEHVAFLRRMEELGLSAIVELLLLNRPVYTLDTEEGILHPFVYKLLFKYKQTICNIDIEPEGVEKIIRYFRNHTDIEGASEVISLLRNRKVS